jgi:hypothetical protein
MVTSSPTSASMVSGVMCERISVPKTVDLVALLLGLLLAGADGARMRLVGAAVGADLVAHARLQLAGGDGDDVVRLAQRQRHVVEQLHLVVADVDQLVVLRMQRADRHEAVDRQLVQRDQVLAGPWDRPSRLPWSSGGRCCSAR